MLPKRLVRSGVRKAAQHFGYKIIPSDSKANVKSPGEAFVEFGQFESLVELYEQRLNDFRGLSLIRPNQLRSKLLARLIGTPPSEGYFIVEALSQCRQVKGDVCEFGVAQGATSALIANEIADGNKTLHLFDSFEGLPKPTERDQLKDDIFGLGNIEAYAGKMACPTESVIARLRSLSFDRYVIHKGFIEHLIHTEKNLPSQVCFAYVDFDFYEPIKTALSMLHTMMSQGGMIIVDDYNFFSTGAKTAVDEFVSSSDQYQIAVPDTRYGYFAVLTKI